MAGNDGSVLSRTVSVTLCVNKPDNLANFSRARSSFNTKQAATVSGIAQVRVAARQRLYDDLIHHCAVVENYSCTDSLHDALGLAGFRAKFESRCEFVTLRQLSDGKKCCGKPPDG
jgi:hypothetical protein